MDVDAIASVDFPDAHLWTGRYQRNNKRLGLKNLRCFPYCGDVHRAKGFCGRPVVMRLKPNSSKPLSAWGEFRKTDQPPSVSVGDVLLLSDVELRIRDHSDMSRTWYPSNVEEAVDGGLVFEFNKRKKGWNYAWSASKHTSNATHSLNCYVFEKIREDTVRCVGVFRSPKFTLYCRKRPSSAPKRVSSTIKRKTIAKSVDPPLSRDSPPIDLPPKPRQLTSLGSFSSVLVEDFGLTNPDVKNDDESSSDGSEEFESETDDEEVGEEDSALLDKQIWRLLIVLENVEKFLRQDDAAEILGLPQFALDDFLEGVDTLDVKAANDAKTTHDLEPIDFGTDSKHSLKSDDARSKRVLSDLASYLLEERKFTEGIKRVAKTRFRTKTERKRAFAGLFERSMLSFLKEKGLEDVSELDEMLENAVADDESSSFESRAGGLRRLNDHFRKYRSNEASHRKKRKIAKRKKRSRVGSSNTTTSSSVASASDGSDVVGGLPSRPTNAATMRAVDPAVDLSGSWRMDADILDALDEIRVYRGVPWLVRKLLRIAELKMEINHLADVVLLRHPRKLMSNGRVTYKADGDLHEWTAPPPAPIMPELMKTYRCWSQGDRVYFVHNYTSSLRSKRYFVKSEDSSRLSIGVQLEERTLDSKKWKVIFKKMGHAFRTTEEIGDV